MNTVGSVCGTIEKVETLVPEIPQKQTFSSRIFAQTFHICRLDLWITTSFAKKKFWAFDPAELSRQLISIVVIFDFSWWSFLGVEKFRETSISIIVVWLFEHVPNTTDTTFWYLKRNCEFHLCWSQSVEYQQLYSVSAKMFALSHETSVPYKSTSATNLECASINYVRCLC